MKTSATLEYRHSHNNLHVQLGGSFSEESAFSLLTLLKREYHSGGRVFINTDGLSDVDKNGANVLHMQWSSLDIPAGLLFLKGEKGMALAPQGSRILIVRKNAEASPKPAALHKHKCCGKCANCKCHGGEGHHHAPKHALAV